MKWNSIYFILLFFLTFSCSHVNEDAQMHYKTHKKFRHGIVPLDVKTIKNAKINRTILPSRVLRGQELYETHCFGCHGNQGRGDGPNAKDLNKKPRNLVSIVKTVPDFKFFMMISQWKSDMPGWENAFTDKELVDLEMYIRSLAK
jgi:cytochrome c553